MMCCLNASSIACFSNSPIRTSYFDGATGTSSTLGSTFDCASSSANKRSVTTTVITPTASAIHRSRVSSRLPWLAVDGHVDIARDDHVLHFGRRDIHPVLVVGRRPWL